jgi:hypothetical protein
VGDTLSDDSPSLESSAAWPSDGGRTEEYPTVPHTPTAPLEGADLLASDGSDDADEEWVPQTTRGIRIGVPAAVLLAIVLVAGGFWGGAALEKSHAGTSSSVLGTLASRFRSAATGASGASGASGAAGFRFGGGLGGSGAAATGTISVVDGDTLYVEASTGSLVKVTLTKSTTVTRNADASAVDLRPGDTVVVQGTTSSGTVTATSVSATAPGVSSGFAGFGRGAGGFGATGATTTSPGTTTTTTPSLFGG